MTQQTTTDPKVYLENLHTTKQSKRVDALRALIQWCHKNMAPYRMGFDEATEKKYQRGLKTMPLALGTGTTDAEREHALRTCARLFTECLPASLKLDVEKAYTKLEADFANLEAKEKAAAEKTARLQAEMEVKFGPFLATLRNVYEGLGLAYTIVPGLQTTRGFDIPTRTFTFSEDYVSGVMAAGEPLPVVVAKQLPVIVKCALLQRDDAGRVSSDYSRLQNAMESLSGAITRILEGTTIKFATPSAPVFEAARPSRTPPPSYTAPTPEPATKAPRASRGPQVKTTTSPKNPFRGIKGEMFERLLQAKQGTWHMEQLTKNLTVADPKRVLAHIASEGARTGKWYIETRRQGWFTFDFRNV